VALETPQVALKSAKVIPDFWYASTVARFSSGV
jgi:hypothetical protein